MTSATDPVLEWARSGAMWLTGRPDGPPLVAPGRPASQAQRDLAEAGFVLPNVLSQRAAFAGLRRSGPWSCGGSFRILPALDGWVGVSLARPSDIASIPALVQGADEDADPWSVLAAWLAGVEAAVAEERLMLLGMPGGAVGTAATTDRGAVEVTVLGERRVAERPVVVDLTSLWAGPLCAHLLGRWGAHVIKVESAGRPDGLRRGSPQMFDHLHAGHDLVRLDFHRDREVLAALIADADVVLEASRPRALRQLGIVAEEQVARGTTWLSITARGRSSAAVGFGDDVAAAAALVVRDGDDLLPAGDALADPLAGVRAAREAVRALAGTEARLIDVSMLHTAAEAADGETVPHRVERRAGQWWVETEHGRARVEVPTR